MKTKKLFFWGRMFAALFFLFNPNVNLIDIFPDAIGYLLLMVSIRNAGNIFPHFDEAYKGFLRLFWLSLAKLPALFVMFSIVGANSYERSIISVFSLIFAVLEIIFAIPAFRALAEGFIHMGEREGLTPMLKAGAGIEAVSIVTLIFLLTKSILSFVPELSLISVFETLGSLEPGAINPARFYPIFAAVGALIVFAVGAVWFGVSASYVLSLGANKSVRAFCKEREALCKDEILLSIKKHTQSLGIYLFLAALLFAFDITLDDKNYLPDAVSGLLFFASLFMLRRESKFTLPGMITAVVYTVNAFITEQAQALFLSKYNYADVAHRPETAGKAYVWVEISTVLEAILLIAVIVLICLSFRDYINKNVLPHMHRNNADITATVRKELCAKLNRFTAFGVLGALYHAVEVFLLTLTDRHVITAEEANEFYEEGHVLYTSSFSYSWIVSIVITALWVCLGIYFLYSLREETKEPEE